MNQLPIVLVVSEGNVQSNEIIENIRKIPNDENIVQLNNGDLIAYKYHLITKYYEIDVLFVPYNEPLNTVPHNLQEHIEGLIIYFNSDNRDFLSSISKYADYLEQSKIELGILLCDQLFDDEKDGITYKEVKQPSKLLDVIELGRTKDEVNAAEENGDHHDPIGYDELIQVLKSCLWSNIQVNGVHNYEKYGGGSTESPTGENLSEEQIEAELICFEKLLNDVMTLKSNASGWSRNERLSYTQNFVDAFDKLIGDGSTDEDDGVD